MKKKILDIVESYYFEGDRFEHKDTETVDLLIECVQETISSISTGRQYYRDSIYNYAIKKLTECKEDGERSNEENQRNA